MADSMNAFSVYSSLELQINDFVSQLNKASQILDSTLKNMSNDISSLNIQPVEIHTDIVMPDISAFEIPAEILSPDRPDMPVATPFSVPSEIENPDMPVLPEEQTYILHTETEPIEPVTIPPADDKNFIQKIKDSFSNLKNAVNSIPSGIAGNFREMGTNIVNTFKSFPSNVATKFSEMKTVAVDKIKSLPSSVSEVIASIPSKIGSGLKTVGTKISDAFKSGVETAKNALKELPEKASEVLKETGEKLKSIAETVAKTCTVAISAVSAGIVAFGKSAVDTGKNFDKSMSQVAATMGKSVEEVADLREFAQEMGRTTAFSATDSADALNYMALAGYDAETSMAMLPNVLNLASAGGMELALASDMITDSQTALGLSLDETTVLVDQMAKASSKSNTSVSQLGDAILTIGGTAKSLSGGTKELTQTLGILADNGIKASESGTHLRNILMAMKPSTEAAVNAWESLGVEAYDSSGKMRKMSDVFTELNAAMAGMTDFERDITIENMFNKTDVAAVKALLSTTTERWAELDAEIEASSGAAKAMADTQLDNLAGQITLFQSALEGAQIAISDQITPALKEFVRIGTDGLSAVTEAFSKGVKEDGLEKGLDNAVSALQPYLDQLIGQVLSAIPKVVDVATKLISVLGQAIVKNIPKLADSAVQLLKGFAEDITKNAPTAIKGFSDMLKSVKNWIKKNGKILISSGMDMMKSIANGISENLPDMIGYVTEIITFISEIITDNLSDIIDCTIEIIGAVGKGIIENLPVLANSALEIIKSLAVYLEKSLPEIIPAVVDIMMQIVETLTAPDTLSSIRESGFAILIGLADGILNSLPVLLERLPTVIQNIVDAMGENVPKFIDVAVNIVDFLCTELLTGKNLNTLIKSAVDIIVTLVDTIVENIDEILLATEQIIRTICDELLSTENLKEIIKTGAELLGKLIVGLCQVTGKFIGFAGLMFEEIGKTLKEIDWGELGIAIVEGICSGMLDCDFVLSDYLNDFGDNWITGMKDIFGIHSPSRVMKDEVGKFLALGIGEGFVENAEEVGQQISGAVADWTSIAQNENFMDNLITGIQSKEKTLADTVKGVAESIRETLEDTITVNTDITANGSFNRLNVPDISTVAENIYTVKSDTAEISPTKSENPITVENLTINVEGTNLNSEYEMNKFINMIADRLHARTSRINRGIGGVLV